MKLGVVFLYFLVFIGLPLSVMAIISSIQVMLVLTLVLLCVVIFNWVYADKIFCSFMDAKKLAPNSNNTFHYVVSRKSDTVRRKRTEIYIYDGSSPKLFILESYWAKTILINETLFHSLNKRESLLVYKQLEEAMSSNQIRILTKFYAILGIIFKASMPFNRLPKIIKFAPTVLVSTFVYPFVSKVYNLLNSNCPKVSNEIVDKYSSSEIFIDFFDIYSLHMDNRESSKRKIIAFIESISTFDFLKGRP